MTEHESIRAMLALSAADALEPGELRRVQQHAESCEICRRELHAWSLHAEGLRRLPQPMAPEGLMERTQARIMEQREVAAARRDENRMLAALVAFGWAASLATWALVRVLGGGSLQVFGANLVSGVTWSLTSTVLVWMTAAAAATMLGKRNQLRRSYEQVS
ncbi:MAG TPA: zf-HC2 domain-containing protein [Bryobacteraceae bacterium]|nr:zf-HC2 domain-containing protein [Bryobacteraceae bacterium]